MGERTPALTTWTLATFDTSLFVLVGVIAAHVSGVLGELLSGLNTVVGVAVFLYVWLLFVAAVRWVLADASVLRGSARPLALRSVAAGGVAGTVFLLTVLLVTVVPSALLGSIQPISVLLILLIGTALSAVVGAVVGLSAGALNVAASRLARFALPAGARP
jgi:hypothetical protein